MKVTVRINEFKRILEEAAFVVPKRPEMPILEFAKLDVRGNHATISAADLAKSLVQTFEAVDSSADGSFLFHIGKVRHFLKKHAGGMATIEITSDGKHNILTAGAFTMRIASESRVCDFRMLSPMPAVSNQVSLKFLKRLLEQVTFAAPNKEGVYAVAAVKVESDGTQLRAIATDGYRIAIAEAQGDFGVFSLLLPKSFVPLLTRRGGAMVRIASSECSNFFETENALIEFSKPTVKFPPWERAVKLSDWKSTVRVSSADLKSVVSSVVGTINAKRPAIFLVVRGDELQVSAANPDEITIGSLRVSTEGDGQAKIKINPNFLMEFLPRVEGEIAIQFKNEKFFLRLSGRNYQYLVLPLDPEKGVPECQAVRSEPNS